MGKWFDLKFIPKTPTLQDAFAHYCTVLSESGKPIPVERGGEKESKKDGAE